MNGTSFAALVVSGIAALMLNANPDLGWRDVQAILAATAARTGSPASWSFNAADNWNGGAMHVSHDYGFGLVDAHAATRRAESWRSVSTSGNEWVADGVQDPASPIAIPDGGSVSSTITLAAGLRIDSGEVDLALANPYLAQLRVTLTAPDGTESMLVHNPSTSQGSIYFPFSTTRDWGESSGGDWTLTVSDTQLGVTGVVYAWGIRAYGDLAGYDTYLYSGEFAALAVADSSRRVLSDAGGRDTVNTAAIAGDTLLDLRPGYAALIAGQEVTIAAGTIIENADSGDGNDTPAAPATAPSRASPATSCSSSPCLLSIPSSEEGILVRTTSAGKNAGWLPVTAMKNGGGTSNNPSHRRRLLLSSLTSLDSGLRRNDEPGLLDVPLHGCC